MALMYVPRNNQTQNQMFQVLTNLAFQKMAHNQRMEIVDRKMKFDEVLLKQQNEAEKLRLEETRAYSEGQEQKKRSVKLLDEGRKIAPETGPPESNMVYDPVLKRSVERPKSDEWGPQQTIDINGKKVAIQINKKNGQIKKIDSQAPEKSFSLKQGPNGELLMTYGGSNVGTTPKIAEKEIEVIRGMENSAYDMIDTTQSILSDVNNDPTVIGATGWAQRKIDSLGSQIEGLVKTIAPRVHVKANLDPNKYDWKGLSSDAAKSASIKSRVIKLAYQVARLREPDARQFSDADIQRAIDEIGGATGSPEQMKATMETITVDAIRSLNRKHKATKGGDYLPSGMTQETLEYWKAQGIPYESIVLEHMKKYGRN